jgi:methylenetetrahydrofolate dehydrogenase (NADP+)/methenyltetrahydrofolate cyclohydrolase
MVGGAAVRRAMTALAQRNRQAQQPGETMSDRKIIDGKAFAAELRQTIARRVAALEAQHRFKPGLAVVLVGENPASQVYVRSKGKQTVEVGMNSFEHKLPTGTSQKDLLALVDRLNRDPAVNGILVQLPLPKQIDEQAVINAIDPDKDVDGFHVVNAGRLATGGEGLVPCTPLGCLMLLKSRLGMLEGKRAIVVGRSNIVGKPMAQLLIRESCTVTVAHSRTRDLPGECRRAEILVAAVGKAEMIRGDWIAPGAVVIDVGINRVEGPDGRSRLVGDVAYDEAVRHAGAITPVPGGVGPMTIACLLQNTVTAACRQRGIAVPEV